MMKEQAKKSFFGLKWLAVLIATLFLVGTFATFSPVNAETTTTNNSPKKITILGELEQPIETVEGEELKETYTVKLRSNNPEYPEIKVPVHLKNFPTAKGTIRFFVFRTSDNKLLIQAFIETAKPHSTVYYVDIPVEDGKATKPLEYVANDKARTKIITENASASDEDEDEDEDEEEATTVSSSNSNGSKSKNSKDKDIFDQIEDFFDQLDSDNIAEKFGKIGFLLVIILAVIFGMNGSKKKARKNRARTNNSRTTRSNGSTSVNVSPTRVQNASVSSTEAIPQRVYRPQNSISNPKLRSQAKKQATKQALQSTSSRSNTSREMYGDTRATRPVSYRPASKEKSHTLPRVLSSRTLPRVLKTPRLK